MTPIKHWFPGINPNASIQTVACGRYAMDVENTRYYPEYVTCPACRRILDAAL